MTTLSASAALRVKLDLAAPALRAATAGLWSAGKDHLRAQYVEYLYAMYALIRTSVPLLEAGARRCSALSGSDPVAAPLGRFLAEHARGERGHDEWLLEDLAAAGADPSAAARRLPFPVVADLAGAQYYWIEHHHPVALLGYVRVLEGNAPSPWLAGRLAALTGLPTPAFRTLREHAELDSGHTAEVDDLLDRLPLTQAHQTVIGVSALRTTAGLTRLFSQLTTVSGGPA
ncbi:iron-containing redox enzyme family protein [Streptomyces griseorubiginosus]|uniref:iron-containing redox enzyme family protein n=1 Tax=Streptomyces griseorubiginosus TaxID=67304 RepID=UPI0033A7723E